MILSYELNRVPARHKNKPFTKSRGVKHAPYLLLTRYRLPALVFNDLSRLIKGPDAPCTSYTVFLHVHKQLPPPREATWMKLVNTPSHPLEQTKKATVEGATELSSSSLRDTTWRASETRKRIENSTKGEAGRVSAGMAKRPPGLHYMTLHYSTHTYVGTFKMVCFLVARNARASNSKAEPSSLLEPR